MKGKGKVYQDKGEGGRSIKIKGKEYQDEGEGGGVSV